MLTPTRPHSVQYADRGDVLPARLRRAARDAPGNVAIVDGDVRLTWAEVLTRAERLAGRLAQEGVRPGDVVLVHLPNWWETAVACWATWLAGGVVLPVVMIYREHELGFIVDQARPAAVITTGSYRGVDHDEKVARVLAATGREAPMLLARSGSAPLVPSGPSAGDPGGTRVEAARPDDVALVLYTSGTTSAPKGAIHTHRTLLAETAGVARWCRLTGEDRVFMASPLSHITGLAYGVVMPADLGSGVVLQDRWDGVAAAELVEAEGCTFTVSATPFLHGLVEAYAVRRPTTSSLRTFVCGGADIPPDLVARAQELLGTRVARTYGSTEMPTLTMVDPFTESPAALDSEGVVMGANEMVVRPDADGVPELLCRGPELFVGYLDPALNDEAFTADGYFRTGDAASDDEGVLRITGRIKDIINRGGEKFSASEIEWGLLSHRSVADVAVVAVPDEILGERACAVVVPAGESPPGLDELRDHLLTQGLAVQKCPERLEIVDALPRTASGKVQKFLLRQRLGLPSQLQSQATEARS